MKYLFVIFVVFFAINKSESLCAKRRDGACREFENEAEMKKINDGFINHEDRDWSVTDQKECEGITKQNQIKICKSTCTKNNNNNNNNKCDENKLVCGGDSGNNCEVFENICELIKRACKNDSDLFPAQWFRCEKEGLDKKGEKGKCGPKQNNDQA